MALNGGEVNFKSVKKFIPRCSLTPVEKCLEARENVNKKYIYKL